MGYRQPPRCVRQLISQGHYPKLEGICGFKRRPNEILGLSSGFLLRFLGGQGLFEAHLSGNGFTVMTWGDPQTGGDSSAVSHLLIGQILQLGDAVVSRLQAATSHADEL